jgi:hypothetical protein
MGWVHCLVLCLLHLQSTKCANFSWGHLKTLFALGELEIQFVSHWHRCDLSGFSIFSTPKRECSKHELKLTSDTFCDRNALQNASDGQSRSGPILTLPLLTIADPGQPLRDIPVCQVSLVLRILLTLDHLAHVYCHVSLFYSPLMFLARKSRYYAVYFELLFMIKQ